MEDCLLKGIWSKEEIDDNKRKYAVDLKKYGKIAADFLDNKRNEENIYQLWIEKNESFIPEKIEDTNEIDIIFWIDKFVGNDIEESLDAIKRQLYRNFKVYIVADNSCIKELQKILKKYKKFFYIELESYNDKSNEVEMINEVLHRITGTYIMFVNAGDLIEQNALSEMAKNINDKPELKFIYSDEDVFDLNENKRYNPFFKPDWSPDTMLSFHYTGQLSLYQLDLVKAVGGISKEYKEVWDYDLTLRCTERITSSEIGHISKILYHKRRNDKKKSTVAVLKKMKEEMLERRKITAELEMVEKWNQFNINYQVIGNPEVSIVIPSKDNFKILKQCIDSIKRNTAYKNYEIIVVDNGSEELNRKKIEKYLNQNVVTYLYCPMEFNFSKMCNIGVKAAKGEYILLLNDDIKILDEKWLECLLGQAMQKHIGAVGAKLIYPETDTIQHVGVTNLKMGPSHSGIRKEDSSDLYYGRNHLNYDWIATTGACLMVERKKYEEVGGLDEELPVAYNDVDFCFKLYEMGYYNTVRADVKMWHYESVSRGYDQEDAEKYKRMLLEQAYMYSKHPGLEVGRDPFFNINLNRYTEDYRLDIEGCEQVYSECIRIKRLPSVMKTDLTVHVDKFQDTDDLYLEGWSGGSDVYMDSEAEFYLILKADSGELYQCKMKKAFRPDVAEILKTESYLSGIYCRINRNQLCMDKTRYTLGILKHYHRKYNLTWLGKMTTRHAIEKNVGHRINQREMQTWVQKDMVKNIEKLQWMDQSLYISGWAILERENNLKFETSIVVQQTDKYWIYPVKCVERYDVAIVFENVGNEYMCGFKTEIRNIEKPTKIYLVKKDMFTGKTYYNQICKEF